MFCLDRRLVLSHAKCVVFVGRNLWMCQCVRFISAGYSRDDSFNGILSRRLALSHSINCIRVCIVMTKNYKRAHKTNSLSFVIHSIAILL